MANEKIYYSYFDTALCSIFAAKTDLGIRRISLGLSDENEFIEILKNDGFKEIIKDDEVVLGLIRDFKIYLQGKSVAWAYDLDLRGLTDFQKKVLNEVKRIPFGETRTYGEIAKKIQDENANRAVGNAVGANPVPIIIPCHRVVGAEDVGGFSAKGGVMLKMKLLRIEKIKI